VTPTKVKDGIIDKCHVCNGTGQSTQRQRNGKPFACRNCRGRGRTFQRITHAGLPGRNRREKRSNAKLAQKAYLADKRATA
jgi:DnaJ-class molecular chaperone